MEWENVKTVGDFFEFIKEIELETIVDIFNTIFPILVIGFIICFICVIVDAVMESNYKEKIKLDLAEIKIKIGLTDNNKNYTSDESGKKTVDNISLSQNIKKESKSMTFFKILLFIIIGIFLLPHLRYFIFSIRPLIMLILYLIPLFFIFRHIRKKENRENENIFKFSFQKIKEFIKKR